VEVRVLFIRMQHGKQRSRSDLNVRWQKASVGIGRQPTAANAMSEVQPARSRLDQLTPRLRSETTRGVASVWIG
jgi:hypothetical protein